MAMQVSYPRFLPVQPDSIPVQWQRICGIINSSSHDPHRQGPGKDGTNPARDRHADTGLLEPLVPFLHDELQWGTKETASSHLRSRPAYLRSSCGCGDHRVFSAVFYPWFQNTFIGCSLFFFFASRRKQRCPCVKSTSSSLLTSFVSRHNSVLNLKARHTTKYENWKQILFK